MYEIRLSQVIERIAGALTKLDLKTASSLLWPALDQFSDNPALLFYAGIVLHHEDRMALSVLAFKRGLEIDNNPQLLINLGATYRRMNNYEEGIKTLAKALEIEPNNIDALVNTGGMYVNEGNPKPGIEYLQKAFDLENAKGVQKSQAMWNLALLKLENGQFIEGFELYRSSGHDQRRVRMYATPSDGEPHAPEPEVLTAEIVAKVRK